MKKYSTYILLGEISCIRTFPYGIMLYSFSRLGGGKQ